MWSLTIKSIRTKKLRFVLTSVAVMLGVAFMAGTLVLTDTIKKSYDDVAVNVYKSTDAVVRSARHVKGSNDVHAVRGTVDAATLARVRLADGVAAAEPQLAGVAVAVGHDGRLVDASPNREAPIALGWSPTPALNPLHLVAGHAPVAADEVVVDRATQRAARFVVGETIQVVGPSGSGAYRLAGVATYGGSDDAAGAQVVAFSQETAARVLGTPGRFAAIQVVARPGVSQTQLVANVTRAVDDASVQVVTGAQAAQDARTASGTALQFVDMFLLTFAIVALVVGSFVIYNTFSITVAQRTKETALLRAIGARRKQVTRAVLFEALLTGVFASAIGVVVGIGTAYALRWVLEAFGMNLPGASMVVLPRTVLVALVVGVVVTVLAAYLPARKAARVAPIQALRDVAVESERRFAVRTVLGLLATIAGAVLMVQGLSGGGPGAVGLGALAVFVGVAMLGPAIARPFTYVLGWPIARVSGISGVLARENTTRNPRRTAATASALMVGVGLVALITVFAASTRSSVANEIDTALKGQLIVDTQFGMGGISPTVASRIGALPEVAAVTSMRYGTATMHGKAEDVSGFDTATVSRTVRTKLEAGSLAQLGAHTVAVQTDEARTHHLRLGDTVTLSFPETGPQAMRVIAIYGTKQPLGAYAMDLSTFDANIPTHVDNDVAIQTAPGTSLAAARSAIEQVLAPYPTAKLLTHEQFKSQVANQINKILNLVYVLLAMALVIAFFGIANTLALSVYERTRELGLLRAVGMSRRQVRATVRWESVLFALLGTALGISVGLAFSWALVRAMHDKGITVLSVPIVQLVLIGVLAALAGVVAAALPARRAARLDVLRAISG
jgi:putative ABC transport system permease protein